MNNFGVREILGALVDLAPPSAPRAALQRVVNSDVATFFDRIAHDVVEAPAFLAAHMSELDVAVERYPSVKFHALRDHAGRVFQTEM